MWDFIQIRPTNPEFSNPTKKAVAKKGYLSTYVGSGTKQDGTIPITPKFPPW
jgi:hypothetical protein